MADWRKLSIDLLLADGTIDEAEVKVLRKELFADGKIDRKEVDYLIELRNSAQKKARARKENVSEAFEKFFFTCLEANVLDNGIISKREAAFIKEALFADGKIDDGEKKFLMTLKRKATKVSPEFETLYKKVVG